MTKPARLLVRIALAVVGLLLVLVVVGIITVQTAWFRNYVRHKIISTVEDDTGGKLEVKTFDFDWRSLEARLTGFVLHGTEPASDPPLFQAPEIVLRLSLFSAWRNVVSLRYLAIDRPSANVIVFPNGDTNIPTPKVARKTSKESSLETVVDLAIGDFEIRNGTVRFLDGKLAFSAHGQNLRAQLNFDPKMARYGGQLSIAPLLVSSGSRPPLNINVVIPLDIEKDKIQIAHGKIETHDSFIDIDAALDHLSDPRVVGQLQAHVALAELANSVNLGIHPQSNSGPQSLDAVIALRWSQQNIEIPQAKMSIGRTYLETGATSNSGATEIRGNVSLDELGRLFQASTQPHGDLRIMGDVRAGAGPSFVINGNVTSSEVSLNCGAWRAKHLSLETTLKVRPDLIEATAFKIGVFGGDLAAGARVENLDNVVVNGSLRGFDLQTVAAAFGEPRLDYSGTVSGKFAAHGNLKLPGRSGLHAGATVVIARGKTGVPVWGIIHAAYLGAGDLLSLGNSRINLPSTQIGLSGEIGKRAEVHIVSRNLSDLQPAWSLASPTSGKFPVTLRGGTADVVIDENGPLPNPRLSGHIAMTAFAVQGRPFDRFAADLAASPSAASIQNGILMRRSLQAAFSGSVGLRAWRVLSTGQLQANATIQNADLSDLLALAGESNIRAGGVVNADAHVNGTIGNPLGDANLNAEKGTIDDQPFDQIRAAITLSDRLITLTSAQLTSPAGQIELHGSFQHPRDSLTTGRAELHVASSQIQLERVEPLRKQRPGMAGVVSGSADIAGEIGRAGDSATFSPSLVNADLRATGVRDNQQTYGNLTATMRTSGSSVNTRIDSDFAGSTIHLNGATQLTRNYPTTADAAIQGLQIEKVLALASPQTYRATGTLSANAHASGTLQDPNASVSFTLAKATIQDEPLDTVTGSVDYTRQLVNLSALHVVSPAGTVDLKATMSHNAFDFGDGRVDAHVASTALDLRRVRFVQTNRPGLAGIVRLSADGSADLRNRNGKDEIVLTRLDANGGVSGIAWDGKPLGEITFQSETRNGALSVTMDSDIGKSAIHGAGQVRLQPDYPINAKVTFGNVTYSGLQGLLNASDQIRPDFDALAEGEATVSGPALEPKNLRGDLQITRLELLTSKRRGAPSTSQATILQNQGPLTAHLEKLVITLRSVHLTGQSEDLTAKGSVSLDGQGFFNLSLNANANLAILKDLYRDVYAGGVVTADAVVRGSLDQPRVNGKIEFKDASLNAAGMAEGISHANGVVSLNGTNATFQNITAESGGGKVTLNGFAGFTGSSLHYNVHATAQQVRIRYSGVSVVSNASASLTGSSQQSLLSGRVTIVKIGYNPDSDVGSLLTQAGTPPEAAGEENGPLSAIRLAVHIQTSPDVRFETSMAQGLDGTADLTLRGTLASPGLVGRVSITAGTLIFFGNKYTVNRGLISFYNPLKIEPVLDVDLETTTQSVDVTLGVSGPIDDLKLTYRSDPPLKFDDIVALLATGRTPPDATIAAHQPTEPEQSITQMGESAIVGQAVANPVASRLQRVFGVSQLKIDPTFATGSTTPQTRVTLEQQISPSITFTYSTDVAQTNSQIIRVEWALSSRFSVVAMRDLNGVFGVDFFYKRKFR